MNYLPLVIRQSAHLMNPENNCIQIIIFPYLFSSFAWMRFPLYDKYKYPACIPFSVQIFSNAEIISVPHSTKRFFHQNHLYS